MIKYLVAPFVVWTVSQTLKVLYRILVHREKLSLKHVLWIYEYGSGPPSTHSALLTSGLWIVGVNYGIGPIFYFCLAVVMILVYNLADDRKKALLLEAHLRKSTDPALRSFVKEGEFLDTSGHTVKELIPGLILGVLLGMLIEWIPL